MTPGLVFCVDLETTSVKVSETTPVQIALLSESKTDGRRILMNTLVRPAEWIPDEVIKIHGITNEMVVGAPDYAVAAWTVNLLYNSFQPEYAVTFNGNSFDVPILNRCMGGEVFPGVKYLDVLDIAYRFLPGLPSYKLGEVYQVLMGFPLENAHDAMTDVTATLDLLKAIRIKIGLTMEQLATEMETPKPYAVMPFGKFRGCLLRDVEKGYATWCLANFDSIRPDLKLSLDMIVAGEA